jgi:serine/threonine protein kinase
LQTLKIGDFGGVRDMDAVKFTKHVGTTIYMAPEVFYDTTYTTQCDVYSFGITLCEMFTRKKPYSSEIRAEIKRDSSRFMFKVSKLNSPMRPDLSANVPKAISTLIERFLKLLLSKLLLLLSKK